jgi:hypothetical protein
LKVKQSPPLVGAVILMENCTIDPGIFIWTTTVLTFFASSSIAVIDNKKIEAHMYCSPNRENVF